MADNIFKDFRKKQKIKHLKAQKARLEKAREQEERQSQPMTPEEEHQARAARRRRRRAAGGVLVVAAFAIVIILIVLYFRNRSYQDYKIITSSEQEDVVSTRYTEMSGKILRYSPDGVSMVNKNLETIWSETYEMQNPQADVCEDRAVIADQDGTTIKILDKNGITGSVTTSYSIVKATVSKSGLVAAILDGDSRTWINFYSTDGSLIAETQTNIQDPGYPLDVAVSDSGVIMMVAYQYVDGSETTSYVAFYNFGDVGQSEDDRIVSGYTYEGTVVPQIEYLSDGKSVAIRDDGFTLYSGRQIPKELKTVEVEQEIVSTFCDDDTIGLVFKNDGKDKLYTMQVYNTDGKLKFTRDFNIPYTSIEMSRGSILMYNSSQLCILSGNGKQKFSGTVDGAISEFFKLSGNRYLLVLDSGVNVIRLQ